MLDKLLAIVLAAIMSVAHASPMNVATPTDEYAIYQDGVVVCVELDTPLTEIRFGDPVVMRCLVFGIDEPYSLRWQSSKDTQTWTDLECTDPVYAFILDEENAGVYYRVVVHRKTGEE